MVASAMQLEAPLPPSKGFDALYGLEFTHISEGLARGQLTVREELKQPAGLLHGGVCAAIAESLASWGTGIGVVADGKVAVGLSNHTSFVRPITGGTVQAVASRRHGGRSTWVWDVEISDDDGRLCALARVTIAIRDR